jgi:hypothetical protein
VVAALLYLSIPWILSISSLGLIDGALACYLFLAFYAVLLWNRGAGRTDIPVRHGPTGKNACPPTLPSPLSPLAFPTGKNAGPPVTAALAGYLAGAAAATKYPGLLFVLLPLAGWVFFLVIGHWSLAIGRWSGARGQKNGSGTEQDGRLLSPRRSAIFTPAVFLLAAALGCGLWFGKNWVLTDNPTYPLLYGAFDGKTWNAEKEARWNRAHRPHDFSLKTLVADAGRVVLTSPGLSPLLVPLAALAFLRRRRAAKDRLAWGLLAYCVFVLAAWWLATHRIDRFWVPVLPLAALLGGAGATWCGARWWRRLLAGLLAAGLAANFLVASAEWSNAWFVPLAALRHDPHRILPWHAYFNAHAAEGGVLAVGDAAVFDLEPPVLYNTCFDDCVFQRLVEGRTAEQVRAELLSRHIACIYIDWDEIERYRSPGNYGFTDFVQPAVFDRLVAQRVLVPLKPIEGSAARAYRVRR